MKHFQSIGSFKTELMAQKAVAALQEDGLDITQATIISSIPYIGEHVAGY